MKKTTILLSIISISVFIVAVLIVQNNLKRLEKEQLREVQAISNTLGQNFENYEKSASGLEPWFALFTQFTKATSVSGYKDGERIFFYGDDELEKAGTAAKYLSSVRTTVREKGSNDKLDIEILFTVESFYKSKAAIVNMIYLIGGLVSVLLGLIYYTNVINRRLNQTNRLLEEAHDALVEEENLRAKMRKFIKHDTKDKLSEVKGRIENLILMIERGKSREEVKNKLIQGYANVESAIQLINNLKTDASSEPEKIAIKKKNIDLSSWISKYVEDLIDSARENKQKLTMQSSTENVIVHADVAQLERCVQNIIRNAMKYSVSNTEIIITIEKQQNSALIHVRDQGKGIPKESWEEIFSPHKRLDEEVEGTGMGLDISRTLLKLMDGNVWVSSSEIGKGSIFTISLPIVENEMEPVGRSV